MHRGPLFETLAAYERTWAEGRLPYPGFDAGFEAATLNRMRAFARSTGECFQRSWEPGHLTGSALVVSPGLDRVLLTHHRKLDKWLQLGGHADGDPRLEQVAMTEAREESGLDGLEFLSYEGLVGAAPPLPFDLDIHPIPARGEVPEHLHYDVRYLIVAPGCPPPVRSSESHDVRWLSLEEARAVTDEESMLRQFRKLEGLRSATGSACPG